MAEIEQLKTFFDQLEQFSEYLRKRVGSAGSEGASAVTTDAIDSGDIGNALKPWPLLAEMLQDDSINDILINGANSLYIERHGHLEQLDFAIGSNEEIFKIAQAITRAMGRTLGHERPLVDTRLADGSRVNIIAPPLAIDGTTISIRKFSKREITLDMMAEQANISPALSGFLKVAGACRMNIIISGGTGSGKTTLLNAISQHIAREERIVTIEDAAELRLQQPHVVRLETRLAGSGIHRDEEVTMRDLVKNALRMRPDRIIVGEVRGPEAFDMMQAMNTGHEGSMTTVHANHPRDALSRMENMISMGTTNIPQKSLRYQLASATHVVVQVSRMRDGKRRVTHITEIVGMEGDMITMHDLFNYVSKGENDDGSLKGEFIWNNIMPRFLRRVAYYGRQDELSAALGIKLPKI